MVHGYNMYKNVCDSIGGVMLPCQRARRVPTVGEGAHLSSTLLEYLSSIIVHLPVLVCNEDFYLEKFSADKIFTDESHL